MQSKPIDSYEMEPFSSHYIMQCSHHVKKPHLYTNKVRKFTIIKNKIK